MSDSSPAPVPGPFCASRGTPAARLALGLAIGLALAGCSSTNNLLAGDKVDYKTSGTQSVQLDVPPDLTQLSRDSRYQAPAGTPVTASELQQQQGSAANPAPVRQVAAQTVGDVRIARQGNQRWLVTNLSPEALWPVLRLFWQEQGFALALDDQTVGVMETQWSENRSKLPAEASSNFVGRLLGSLYDTGERDRFRTRIERGSGGTEVYISHRGIEEVYTNARQDQTTWQGRPSDPSLEAEMLSRLMIKLGAKPDTAKAEVREASAQPVAAKARLDGSSNTTVVVDDGFDNAWRRVGLALDRSGFTVEDRDRGQGVYYVRYADPLKDRKSEGGFLSRLFGSSSSESNVTRYRLSVKAQGNGTVVSVLNEKGQPEANETTRRIAKLLVDELK